MDWILSRLGEPSTYAGFAALAASIGISQPIYSAASAVAVALFGLVGVLKSEGKI